MEGNLEQTIIEWHNDFEDFPPDAHLCCPKLNDDDLTDYENLDFPDEPDESGGGAVSVEEKKKRNEDYKHRLQISYNLSLLMGLPPERSSTWLPNWKERVETYLTRCDSCIRRWHRAREPFLQRLPECLRPEHIRVMETHLDDFDRGRIDRGLKEARDILERNGPMTTTKLVQHSISAVLALFEALCSWKYLAFKDRIQDFDYVFENTQRKKPAKLPGGLLPSMTSFLFSESKYKRDFAEAAWDRREPESLKQDEWDWAVSPWLTESILWVSMSRGGNTPDKIPRFWRGFSKILRLLGEKQIVNWLRAMEVSPNIYFLALEHLMTDSDEALLSVLQGLQGLMEKAPKAFWAAFAQLSPSTLVEQIFMSPGFRPLLNNSLLPERMESGGDSGDKVPALAGWLMAFIRSLPQIQRSDACDTVLQHLLSTFRRDPSCDRSAHATCTLSGLVALHECLKGFLDPENPFDTQTSLITVNQLLNKVLQYGEVIIGAAKLRPGDTYNIGLSKAGIAIIHSALALDARATEIEWKALVDRRPVQNIMNRDSGKLWESFLEMLWPSQLGHFELAEAMLQATLPLRAIEKFIPKRKDKLKKEHEVFNNRYQQQTAAIGKVLNRMTDFTQSELANLCSSYGKTIQAIVSSLIHGEEAIREAGFELIKAITDEMVRSDAIERMVERHFQPFVQAITNAVEIISAYKGEGAPWTHMIPILQCSDFVLNGLCDPSSGQLRRKTLTADERAVVKSWWRSVWRAIDHSFRMMRKWHEMVEKKVMEDFCRDVMELANKLFEQDGVLASALSHQESSETGILTSDAMKDVLEPPRFYSFSLVDMLQLRDQYLISGIIRIVKQLITRMKQQDMALPPNTLLHLGKMIKDAKRSHGARPEYPTKTNLTDEQRIELLKALGEDAVIEEQFMGIKPGEKEARERALKQSKLDFFKATSKDYKDPLLSLTPTYDKNRSKLEQLKSEIVKPKQPTVLSPAAISAKQASLKEARAREKAEKAKRDAEAIAKARALRAPAKIVAGEGSGLQGIAGAKGKDHAPALKDEIMVGSSSEDEDESDDDDEVIVLKAKKANKTLSEADQRRLELLMAKNRGPVKKVKLMRSAKDMRARLIPPMDTLHLAILEWDIFHEGNDPPNGYHCAEVSNTYNDPVSYKQTFFPLLINEAWRSFVTAKDETTSKQFGIKVLSRMAVDKFVEVTASVPAAVSKDRGLSEGDIVLMSRGEDPLNQPEELHCLSRIWKTTYKKDIVEVVYRLNGRGNPIHQALVPGSEFSVVKITNMTTIEREYAALESLQYYDLMDEVLKAEPSPMLNFGDQAIKGVMDNYQLNLGQAKAILNAKENDGFTLVQGPPGTGKTKTIVAMVGCLLSNSLKGSNGAVSIPRPGLTAKPTTAPARKLLVCAPSNAAVDELVLRLKQGVKTMNGTHHKIEVLRLGRTDAINAGVKDVTLDEQVKARMEAVINSSGPSDREQMHKEAGEIKVKLSELRPQLDAAQAADDHQLMNKLKREYDDLMKRRAHIGARIEADKSSGNTFQREVEIKRRQVQQEILDKAQVLCATLSGSGHEMFKNLNVEFETVIIDEAAQCVELSALIPLKYGCSKCILVGDPKQLPPTVLSQSAARYGYDQSLFVRMQKNHAKDVHLLDMQYRMHPEISRFPSKEFYEGLLQDGADMAGLRLQPWHQSVYLGPYRFFDVKGSQSRGPKNQSLVNEEELKVAMKLYQRFRSDYSNVDARGKIGIITPYKAQLHRLRQRFTDKYGEGITEEIEFNTTDAFQGRECEIIIFSCVRASPTGGIGFMTDIRRMNVGLTRAKSSLWILGDSRALQQGEYWNKLIEDAKERDRYTTGNILAMLDSRGPQLPAAAFKQLGAPPPAAPRPRPTEDVEMPDAPSSNVEMPDAPPANLPYRRPSGPRDDMPPTIQPTVRSTGKKRARDSNDDGRPSKKIQQNANTARHNMNAAPPVMPRAATVKPPIDPSAMEVLGLAPPERAPAAQPPRPQQWGQQPQVANGPGPGQGPRPNGPPNGQGQRPSGPPPGSRGPVPPARKPASDPFIRRKPGPRR
ncbi:DEAD-box type RNA helicase [Podospora bellae-mahoneyi]|uniref:DEAD-box type RNA helicase n=1 Tax=Podospora bellae-mahoneyi TaxID=2093777 RepID=A0ABR0G1F1_9PEZI|nr:DEAD-box type RNA helicase [Podospora bellae-mahoneyi]